MAQEPKEKEENKYAELDVKRVQKWIERRERRVARDMQKVFFQELKKNMLQNRNDYKKRRMSYFGRSR